MKKLLTFFVVAACVTGAGEARAQQSAHERQAARDRQVTRDRVVRVEYQGRDRRDQRDEQTERTTHKLKIGANGEVHISNIAGDISLVRGGGNDATLEVIKTSRGRTVEDARSMLDLVQVDIVERAGRAEIKTRYPQGDEWRRNRRNIDVSVAFLLTAPSNTRVTVNSVSGDITAKDIRGDIALESVSGSIRISSAGRVAAAKSVSGNVEIADTDIEGQLETSSVSGSVHLRNVRVNRLEAGSVSGNVVVEDVECDRVEAQTVSGNVRFSGPLARNGRYEMSSHSGSVNVTITGGAGFELEATSFSGSVRSDVTLKAEARSGRDHHKVVRGTYGDGSAVLDLTSFSGSIVVSRR